MTTNRKLRVAVSVAWRASSDVFGPGPHDDEVRAALQYIGSSPAESLPGEWQLKHAQRVIDVITHELKTDEMCRPDRVGDFEQRRAPTVNDYVRDRLFDLYMVVRRCETVDRIRDE